MYKEPAFMKDIHKKQEKEYKKTKNLSLRQFVMYINNKAEIALKNWGLEEKSINKVNKIILAR